MCLFATHRFPKFSRKPKKVYKVLISKRKGKQKYIATPCQKKEIIFNNHTAKLQASLPWYKESFRRVIGASGVHSFATLKAAQRWCHGNDFFISDLTIYTGIIPHFTLYWTGNIEDIASSKLIIYDDPNLV